MTFSFDHKGHDRLCEGGYVVSPESGIPHSRPGRRRPGKQGTFVPRVLTERTVSYFHNKKQSFESLDVERREWTPVAAPYFDSAESLGLSG